MRLSRRMAMGVTAAWLCAPMAAAAPIAERDGGPAEVADRLLQAVAEASGVPGLSIAIVADGTVTWTGTSGVRDIEHGLPVVPATAFRLASVSKLITATAAMRLQDQGRLDPDSPVQQQIADLDPAWPPITARQLAAHTSGLPHYQEADADRGGVAYTSVRQAVGLFNRRPLLFRPGESYAYSSWGYTLLSAVVEAAAGAPFLEHVARDVTAGLDIVPDTAPPGPIDTRAYTLVERRPVEAGPHDYSYSWGGAGFRAPASAVALFGDRVMAPGFLSDAAREAMWTPTTLTNGASVTDDDSRVAFGWRIGASIDGERIAHHAGAAIGARSVLLVYPERRVSVALLSNAGWTSAIERTAEMIAAPFLAAPAADPDAPCPVGARTFEGSFGSEPVAGVVQFRLEGDLCRGVLSADHALGAWMNRMPNREADRFEIIALRADRRLGRAAFISPIGAHELRRAADGALSVDFGGARRLVLRLN